MDKDLKVAAMLAYPILRFFEYGHLPPKLQSVSGPLCELAFSQIKFRLTGSGETVVPLEVLRDAETSAGLRHLLEAKDCFVRAAL